MTKLSLNVGSVDTQIERQADGQKHEKQIDQG